MQFPRETEDADIGLIEEISVLGKFGVKRRGEHLERGLAAFRAAIDAAPISKFQLRIVLLTVLVIISDGYDTQAIGYVVPALAQGWHVKVSSFGLVFSA